MRGSNIANVAQLANGSSAPVIRPANAITTAQCSLRCRTESHTNDPIRPSAIGMELKATTSGQLSNPRKGGYGTGPGVGLVVRGSP